jgi:eukaryotic-like serine/threonine-protein kinase
MFGRLAPRHAVARAATSASMTPEGLSSWSPMSVRDNTARTDVSGPVEACSIGETRALPEDEQPSDVASIGAVERSIESLAMGESVGRYVVLEDLARGGMSIVYVALDPELDRRVALKVMRPDLNEAPDRAQERLLREAMAMAKLAHPNVVRVYDVGTIGARVYMAMELVEGQTLRDWMTAKPRDWRKIVDVLVRAGRGLAAAHEAGLVHLDFKPRNVLVGKDGEVRVVDFGLARIGAGTDSASFDVDALPPVSDENTSAGVVMGTPGYMAPEQLGGIAPDARSDQFSFCVTAWEALYGQRPYPGRRLDTYRVALAAGDRVEPLPAANARVPLRLRRLLERGLALDPAQRHRSLVELLDGMTRDPWRPWRRAGLLLGAAGSVALATWSLVRAPDDPCTAQAQRLERAWSPARREAAHARLADDDAARRQPVADAIVTELDAYAAGWIEVAAETCRDARAEGRSADDPYDVRGYCLDHRRHALQAATDLVLEPSAPASTPWERMVAELPSVAACRDATSVHHVGKPPPNEALRQSVARIDEQLARAWMLLHAGRSRDALEVLEPAVRTAEATGHRPTLAQAKHAQAAAYGRIELADEAERAGFEAVWLADAEGMHSVRVEAYTSLVFVVGMLGGRGREAENLGQTALWIERNLAPDPQARARLLANLGATDTAHGHYERARERFLEALALHRAAGTEAGDIEVATTLQGVGAASLQLGQYERALAMFREARRTVTDARGPTHPVVMLSLENEATVLHALERYDEAIAVLEQARTLLEGTPVDRSLTQIDATLGAVLIELRRYPEARDALARVVAALTSAGDDLRPLQLGVTYGNLAIVDLELGRPAEAELDVSLGLRRLEQVLDREHPYRGWLLGLRARAELERGKPREAIAHAAAAWELLATADARDDRLVEPEMRAEPALVLSRALLDPEVAADPELVGRFGGGRTPRAWAELAVHEAEQGGRSAAPVLERARRWLAALP